MALFNQTVGRLPRHRVLLPGVSVLAGSVRGIDRAPRHTARRLLARYEALAQDTGTDPQARQVQTSPDINAQRTLVTERGEWHAGSGSWPAAREGGVRERRVCAAV
ncbi:hypothetical protein OHB04_00475 [Streptomyces sp. NBC_01775]|uniref:hypothetical protein n=1 Tax=Streptomyces sp. NBC_01775 TaxID=2975939 RepID=UPI002DD9B432|nr:hypothetical protein [Streptomyces sp. NBC_01775]WSB74402.1 hypothetical protein OHB04_00475 [Streptomyces sp. NBC_01775]